MERIANLSSKDRLVQSTQSQANPEDADVKPHDRLAQSLVNFKQPDYDGIKERFERFGQDHVFTWEDQLDSEERRFLYRQLEEIDLEMLADKYEASLASTSASKPTEELEPLPAEQVASVATATEEDKQRWYELGIQKIAEGRVAALVLAGGQGTRLGSPLPKGMYDVGLPSHKSLFQIQAERILKLQQLASEKTGKPVVIRWYVMTSIATDAVTQKFFHENDYFGLEFRNITFFMQSFLPCITPEGKLMMESAKKVATAPDGNGGVYAALKNTGIIEEMKNLGIDYLFQYCVDNILIKPCDPIYTGLLYESDADVGSKVVSKNYPEEPVGLLCLRGGKYCVAEYSEIGEDITTMVDDSGALVFNTAHICINTFRKDFLEDSANRYNKTMPYHIAKKKIPHAAEDGTTVEADTVNGWKLEQFIFDVFPCAKKVVALEILREEEFSPLKNGAGSTKDNAETCCAHLSALHKRYIEDAGGVVLPPQDDSDPRNFFCEISPLLTFAGEGLDSICRGKTFTLPVCLEQKSFTPKTGRSQISCL
eukprot:CAMPEP_0174259408 /NCGR_PEP_ID=MMETSP0439-20130205/8227_1 /TAXON_ID=0 /ORGANISM="Stereomyxa ramosa, Strain Chinc5" /LENGTH=538 /DNA_ID=CAMNT_0015343281 /DNA_START=9 /DNA_END=1625 /DNA_ORIENTATION=-